MITINETSLKNITKELKLLSSQNNCEIQHTAIIEAISRGLGYKNFNILKPALAKDNASHQSTQEQAPDEDTILKHFSTPYIPSKADIEQGETFSHLLSWMVSHGIGYVQSQNIIQWHLNKIKAPATFVHDHALFLPTDISDVTKGDEDRIAYVIMRNFLFFMAKELFPVKRTSDTYFHNREIKQSQVRLSNESEEKYHQRLTILKLKNFERYIETKNGVIHIRELILNNATYDEKLLMILNVSAEDFLKAKQKVEIKG
ncbi:MAG: hypothetical protein WC656_01280 [Sulfurimonas sp.]|jgi:hypothetical protein